MYAFQQLLSTVLDTGERKTEQGAPSLPQVAQSTVKRQTGQ